MKRKKPRHATYKQLNEDLDSINEKILKNVQKYYSFQQALDSILYSMKKLTNQKIEIQLVLQERKRLTNNLTTIKKIERLLKK